MSNKFGNGKRMFFRTIEKSEVEKPKTSAKKVVLPVLGLIIAGIIITYIWLGFNGLFKNWSEIKFASDHPALVKSIRTEYVKKHSELDEAFLKSATAGATLTPEVTVTPTPTEAFGQNRLK